MSNSKIYIIGNHPWEFATISGYTMAYMKVLEGKKNVEKFLSHLYSNDFVIGFNSKAYEIDTRTIITSIPDNNNNYVITFISYERSKNEQNKT